MFGKNKRIKLDRLFNLQFQEKLDEIGRRYLKINLSQAEEANRLGYLHDGKYANIFLNTQIDKSTEMLKALCDIFKSVYFENRIKFKYLKLLYLRILEISKKNLTSFDNAVDSNPSILFPNVKDSLKIEYKIKMGIIVSGQIRSIEIEHLKRKRFKNIINEINGEAPSNLKTIKWLLSVWENHKVFVCFFIILVIVLLLYSNEIKDNLKNWINIAIDFYL